MSMVKLKAEDVVVRLGGTLVVDGASFDLEAGELAVLIGPNGAGKTTLARSLAGLIPAEGRIAIEGRSLDRVRRRRRDREGRFGVDQADAVLAAGRAAGLTRLDRPRANMVRCTSDSHASTPRISPSTGRPSSPRRCSRGFGTWTASGGS